MSVVVPQLEPCWKCSQPTPHYCADCGLRVCNGCQQIHDKLHTATTIEEFLRLLPPEITARTKRTMAHEAGHALTAHDYGFGVDSFQVRVTNDPTGATYNGVIALTNVTDAEIEAMEDGKKGCYAIVCAAGVAAEAVLIGNIADGNLIQNSADRDLLARFLPLSLDEFIEDAKTVVGAKREIHLKVAERLEQRFWRWVQLHPVVSDGLYVVMDRAEMDAMFEELKNAIHHLIEKKYPHELDNLREAWIRTWAHEAGHSVIAEHLGLPLEKVVLRRAPDGHNTFYNWYAFDKWTPPSGQSLAETCARISTACAGGIAAEEVVFGEAVASNDDPENPDKVQVATLVKKFGTPGKEVDIRTFAPAAKDILVFHRKVFDDVRAFYLKRADELARSCNDTSTWGKEHTIASRAELDQLLKPIHAPTFQRNFKLGGRNWKIHQSSGWAAFCVETGKMVAADDEKTLVKTIKTIKF
jgi:hypothetical protein